MTKTLVLVGVSHHRAPVEVRERASLPAEGERGLSAELAARGDEVVCLSTCNRTEVYVAAEDAAAAEDAVLGALSRTSALPLPELDRSVYRLRGEDVCVHLFRVAAGLDSLVPGEAEILGQVRGAFERGEPGALLDRLFREAIFTGRKVRRETGLGDVPASVAGAAAALVEQLFGDAASCRVALVGAGKTGELAARRIVERGARIAVVANRSLPKAEAIAARFGAEAVPLDTVAEHLAAVDVVVASTSARGYVVTAAEVASRLRERKGRPLFFVDIAVPRDVEPAVNDLDGCFLYDIDDLDAVVAESVPGRAVEAARAEAIVAREAERFHAWRAAREVAPAIASMRAQAERIRAEEVARARNRLGRLTEAELRVIETATARIVEKLLHGPTLRLKEVAAGTGGGDATGALLDLLGLSDDARPGRDARQ
jgi:glutamyl-tRNA reductase